MLGEMPASAMIEARADLGPGPETRQVQPPATYADWEAVYQDNVVGIYQLVYRRVGNAADAEDLAEEVLLRTLKALRLPAAARSVRAYLVQTANTVLADHWRRHYAAKEAVLELQRLPPDPLSGSSGSVAVERAERVLGLLPENFRRVLELRFLRGFSVREVARELRLTESNVRVIQFRALRKAAQVEREAF